MNITEAEGPGFEMKAIPLEGVFAFLLYRDKEAILVDCGRQGSAERIMKAMANAGLQAEHLKLLLLTHTHFDHCGSAREIQELTGCKVAVHAAEAGRLSRGRAPFPGGTRWKSRMVVLLGRIFRPLILRFSPVDADLVFEGEGGVIGDLTEFGFHVEVHHFPGHTAGSLGLLLPGGIMLVADTLTGIPGMKMYPAFAENRKELRASWKRLLSMDLKKLYPSHGTAVNMKRFRDAAALFLPE